MRFAVEPEEWQFSELESFLKVDKMAHVALEASIIGLFGLCKPFFSLEQRASFDCKGVDSNLALLEQGLYLPLPEVRRGGSPFSVLIVVPLLLRVT